MRRILTAVSLIFLWCSLLWGHKMKVMVYFRDKGPMTISRQAELADSARKILSAKARFRRMKRGQIKGITEADFPVYKPYIHMLKKNGFIEHHALKWFNAVSGTIEADLLKNIERLPFVKRITPVKTFIRNPIPMIKTQERQATVNRLLDEIEVVNASSLKEMGLSGKGVIVGMFDTGFNLYHPALDSIREHLIAQYDFVHNDSSVVDEDNEVGESSHGTVTSSVVGGYFKDSTTWFEGLAPGASFILCKTEYAPTETHIEEDNWAAAAEWAEAKGVDIISSSLGYFDFDPGQTDYTYEDMDGHTTIVAQAANFLTDRGVIVVNSAGNEGNDKWYHIISPADAPAVITVGAMTFSGTYYVAGFSSRGPTADGRIKPEVVAPGVGVDAAYYGGGFSQFNGTSLACPLVAGALTLIMEAFPDANPGQIRSALLQASSNEPISNVPVEPNNDSGWGLPDFLKLYNILQSEKEQPERFLNIFPNPASGSNVTVLTGIALKPGSSLTAYNVLGQKVYSRNLNEGQSYISFRAPAEQGWPSGIYFIQLVNGSHKITTKFIWIK